MQLNLVPGQTSCMLSQINKWTVPCEAFSMCDFYTWICTNLPVWWMAVEFRFITTIERGNYSFQNQFHKCAHLCILPEVCPLQVHRDEVSDKAIVVVSSPAFQYYKPFIPSNHPLSHPLCSFMLSQGLSGVFLQSTSGKGRKCSQDKSPDNDRTHTHTPTPSLDHPHAHSRQSIQMCMFLDCGSKHRISQTWMQTSELSSSEATVLITAPLYQKKNIFCFINLSYLVRY